MDCQAIFERKLYETKEECLLESNYVSQYMQEVYPNSSGEIYCLSEDEFEAYNQHLKNKQFNSTDL